MKQSQSEPSHVIKAKKNEENIKNPKYVFLGTRMCAHTRGVRVHPMCTRTHFMSMHMHA